MHTGAKGIFKSAIDALFLVVTLTLAARIVLKIAAANPATPIVSLIYDLGQFFMTPFRGIFADQRFQNGSVLDMTAFVALVVYLTIAYVVSEMLATTLIREHYKVGQDTHAH